MLIGLTGYPASGKDTVADILVAEYEFVRLSFAAPLKLLFVQMNGMENVAELEARKRNERWIREGLQHLGSSKREIRESYWVDMLNDELEAFVIEGEENFVITDVRYPDEADAIHSWGGKLWRIERPGYGAFNDHPSEQPIETIDLVIHNNRDVNHLDSVVCAYVEAENLNSSGRHTNVVDLFI